MDIARATGAAIEVQAGGQTYKVRPLTFGDMGDLESWLISRRIAAAVVAMGKDSALIGATIAEIARQTIGLDELFGAMGSMAGMVEVLYLALRRDQPNLTREAVGDLITAETLPEWQGVINALNDTQTETPEETEASPKGKRATTGGQS